MKDFERVQEFEKGHYIRAYDFRPCRGRDDQYVEGLITDIRNNAYHVDVEIDTVFSNPKRPSVIVPIFIMHDFEGRVFRL